MTSKHETTWISEARSQKMDYRKGLNDHGSRFFAYIWCRDPQTGFKLIFVLFIGALSPPFLDV